VTGSLAFVLLLFIIAYMLHEKGAAALKEGYVPTMFQSQAAPSGPPSEAALTALIIKSNYPMPAIPPPFGTGGHIAKITPEVAAQMAHLILSEAARVKRDPIVIAAWIAGESRFDPRAENPNLKHSFPGETPQGLFEHTDIGIGQISGRWLYGMDGMAGLTWHEQYEKALDPEWSVPHVVTKMDKLLTWAVEIAPKYPAFAKNPELLAYQAYNSGQTGALNKLAAGMPFDYATKVAARIAKFRVALG
jgi:hypothetical protein